jgi:acyl-coenzyme A thioesterase PaaI-like protein
MELDLAVSNSIDGRRPWAEEVPEGRLMNRGHPAGDLLEAYDWTVLRRGVGELLLECRLPETCLDPQRQLFGGFTGAYVDLVALYTSRTDAKPPAGFQSTIDMRVDYFEPICEGTFNIEGRVLNRRGKNCLISVQMRQSETTAVYGFVTLRATGE